MTTARRATIEEMYDPTIGCVVANESGPARAGNTCDSGPDHCKGVAMSTVPYPDSPETPSPRGEAELLASTAMRFGKFEAEYFADSDGRAAINAMFAAVATAEKIISEGRMSPELSEIIAAMADTFEVYQKAA